MDLYLNQKKNHKGHKILGLVALILVLCIGILCFLLRDAKGDGSKVEYTIPKGESIVTTAGKLKDRGLVASKWGFILYAKTSGRSVRVNHGTFILKSGMTKAEILDTFSKPGIDNTITFTIPEGYSAEMIGDVLEKKGVCKKVDFQKAANRTEDYTNEFLKEIPKNKNYKYVLEGFLYPDTYNVYKNSTAKQVIQKMLDNFEVKYNQLLKKEKYSGQYSMFELVTIASIVEREAEVSKERPIIAGVIENRLKISMRLQVCPSVLYVTTKGKYDADKVYYKDLKVDSPYNTYKNQGLPIGPISNPSIESLEAAMHPASHDYLFYHMDPKGKGTHIFTKTYEEHEETQIIGKE